MPINAGSWDRIIRIIMGLALIGAAILKLIGWWGWIGAIPLATGVIGFCPVYPLLNINTYQRKSS